MIELFTWFFSVLLVLVIVINGFVKKRPVSLYTDNGKRVNFKLSLSEWEDIVNRERVECSSDNLVECNVSKADFDCFSCKAALSSCQHFSDDEELYGADGKVVGVIPKNRNEETGYCLRMAGKGKRECTTKNGGKWLLSKNDEGKYAYICYCSTPKIFSNSSLYGNCTNSSICLHGKIREGWNSLEKIECDCDSGYISMGTGINAKCLKKNSFQKQYLGEEHLKLEYIDKEFRGRNLALVNPCIIDALTGELTFGGKVVLTDGIAYCEAVKPGVITLQFDDDYLIGNGGKFANGIVSITDDPGQIETNGEIAETHTKREDGSFYGSFIGFRIKRPHETVKLKYPFLDSHSANMGGLGTLYNYMSIIKNKNQSYMYFYHALTPEAVVFTPGTVASYIPVFSHAFEATIKQWHGNVPVYSIPIQEENTLYASFIWKGPFGERYPIFSRSRGEYRHLKLKETPSLTSNFIAPLFFKKNEETKVNPYSSLFSGIFLTRTIPSDTYTVGVSPGKVLATKYRFQVDSDWTPYRITKYNETAVIPMVVKEYSDFFGVSADGPAEDVTNPGHEFTYWEIDGNRVKYTQQY